MKTRDMIAKICFVLASGFLVAFLVNAMVKVSDVDRSSGEKTLQRTPVAQEKSLAPAREAAVRPHKVSSASENTMSHMPPSDADTSDARKIAENMSDEESTSEGAGAESALMAEKMREASRKVSPFPLSVKDVTQILPNAKSPAANFISQSPSLPINTEQESVSTAKLPAFESVSNETGPVAASSSASSDAVSPGTESADSSTSSDSDTQNANAVSPDVLSAMTGAPALPSDIQPKTLPSFTPVINNTGPVPDETSTSPSQ